MALYRFEVHWPSGHHNSSGAVAKAAYINRDRYRDEHTGKIHDYRKGHEEELQWKAVFVDPKFNPPDWVHNPENFWNRVAAGERRKDALQCQDAIGNLPHELTREQNKLWVTDFIRESLTRGTGRVVNVAFHKPSERSDDRNHHCHMQWSLRAIGPEGFDKKKLPMLNKQDIECLREQWAKHGAKALEKAGFDLEAQRFRVGHLTLEKQREEALRRGDKEWAKELDREPTKHMGPQATAIDREGQFKTRKGAENDAIRDRNRKRAEGREGPDWKRENLDDLTDATTPQAKREPLLTGDKEHIYFALKNAKTPEGFIKDIEQRGLHVARVTAEDAQHSQTSHYLNQKFNDKYSPKYQEGEYVVVNERGWTFRLNERSTGKDSKEIKAFLKPLDKTPMPSLRERLAQAQERWVDGRDVRPWGRKGRPGGRDGAAAVGRGVERAAVRVSGSLVNTLGNLFTPPQTPEEKRDAKVALEDRRARDEEAIRRGRDDGSRDR